VTSAAVEHTPSFPGGYRPGVGIVGCGGIVKLAHLPAYTAYDVDVVGVYDPDPAATDGIQERFPVVGRVFDDLDALLADPAIEVVDVATHPGVRPKLVRQAIEAGKHVLSQKPLALDIATARDLVEAAASSGVRLAVNQNGRWAPPWRIATRLVEDGAIGDVFAVTHVFDHDFDWIPGTVFDEVEHLIIYDFSIHWVDISRCWLDGKTVTSVQAREYRTPAQPPESKAPVGAWISIAYEDGSSVLVRSVGSARTERPGNPFWIHGSEGTIRGSVRKGSDFVELERDGVFSRYRLTGEWMPDGFAGTMAELLSAVAEDREPFNSASHNLLSLQLTLAACRSAEDDGRAVRLDEVD
jgi:predicted dehydrogenase